MLYGAETASTISQFATFTFALLPKPHYPGKQVRYIIANYCNLASAKHFYAYGILYPKIAKVLT